MTDLQRTIEESLAPLVIPVWFQNVPVGKTPPSQYTTYVEYLDGTALNAGDVEQGRKHFFQVNVWSKTNYNALVENVKELLEASGFEYTTGWDQPYADGDTHYNRVMRFIYVEEI